MTGLLGECAVELALLAGAAGDAAGLRDAAAMTRAPVGAAFAALGGGDAAGAAAAFATLRADAAPGPDAPWWRTAAAADLDLGAALALAAAGDRAAARDALDTAAARFDAIAGALPPAVLTRRRHLITEVRHALRD
jgi:hypothetical protein